MFLEAAFWLVVSRLALSVLRFQTIGRYLGEFHAPSATPAGTSEAPAAITREVAWAVHRAATALPFRSVCLPRALAASQMLSLRDIPYRVHFGAQRGPGSTPMQLHAWVDAAGVDVAGTRTASEFTEVGFFARSRSRPGKARAGQP